MGLSRDLSAVARGWRWGRRPLVPRSVETPPAPAPAPDFAWARSPLAGRVRAAVLRFGFMPLLRAEVDASVEGREIFDVLQPPVVFVANHTSHLDAPLILTSLPRAWREKTVVAAAADYFFDAWWRATATAIAFNAFPIERSGHLRSTDVARGLLADGWNLLVFPEGTRSRDGWVADFKRGAAMLAAHSGVPVVPIAMRGAFRAMPRGRAWPIPGRPPVGVRFGPPVFPRPDEDSRSFNARVRTALARTHEEDATSWWEALRKEADGSLGDLAGPPGARWRRVWEATRPPARTGGAWRER